MSQPDQKFTTRYYVIGFVLSLILTLTAYFLVVDNAISKSTLIGLVVGLALVQLIVQLVFFLHVGREGKPFWNLQAFIFMLGVVVILVGGSLWIMSNLSYHHGDHMTPQETDRAIIKDEGFEPSPQY